VPFELIETYKYSLKLNISWKTQWETIEEFAFLEPVRGLPELWLIHRLVNA